MSLSEKFTKAQLVSRWLQAYPQDKDDPDLEFNALAGYVETKDGLFVAYRDWDYERHGALKPTEEV
jgi:hypothetical protein